MTQFLAMGGYAAFVWPAYAISVAVLAGLTIWAIGTHRQARETLRRLEDQRG